ncbi:SET and MYND domain-containing protein 4-like [Actinia tenebrosa]|uniref:Protein-lysine N-methyltransferase SMYD4 n=1 Tax=Actinia tenebrosa TaxID=6105 RepID=A0A6P8ID68_ACTTE|nr:SET and MYND domain-containing protein 4-like [Actinia tenebrosa]XP_031563261.1 SET and MYND domain-containing protein 4-like [Actinia tenebrosa]
MSFNLKEEWEKIVVEQLSRPHLKDFGKLKTDLERFRFCRSIISNEPRVQDLIQTVQKVLNRKRSVPGKSIEKVQQFASAGDDCCVKKQFRKAVPYYSKSIQYFPCKRNSTSSSNEPTSLNSEPTLAAVLTRRAEALFMVGEYEACLNDIREASSLQYNHTLSDCLIKVEKACLKKQDRQARASTGSSSSPALPELAGGQHDKIANGSKLIAINHDAKQGRFLQACDDIRAGDALIAEKPFAAVLLPENSQSYCDNCFKPLVAPYSCRKCCSVLYCSPSCRDNAWMEYHSVECSLFPVLEMLDTFVHLSLRVLLAAGPEQILNVLQETCTGRDVEASSVNMGSVPGCTSSGAYPGDYSSVFSLVTNSELQPVKALMSYSLNSAFLMEFLEDAVSLPKTQRLRSQENETNCADSGQNELDSDDDSVNLSDVCQTCEQERTVDVISYKRSHSESSDELGCKDGPMKNVLRCGKMSDSLGLYNEEFTNTLSEEVVGSLLLHHQQQMLCNVHAITTIVSTSSSDEEGDEDYNSIGVHGQVISREQRRIATAIYSTGSLLNHACDPDVIVSFVDGVLVVRATHNISPGSAITHCYGPHASRMPREERQKLLFKQYFFTCQCSACTRDEEMEKKLLCFSAFACQNCKGAMTPSIVDSTVGRCQNKDCNQEKSLEEELRLACEADLFFCKGIRLLERVGVHDALEVLLECLRIRKQILHQYNKDLAETHDAIARCHAMIGDFKNATHHCLQSSEAVEKAYGSSSVEYGHELHKLSQLLFNDQQVKKALATIDKAVGLLGTHYGHCHPDVKELGEMKKCLVAVNGKGNHL